MAAHSSDSLPCLPDLDDGDYGLSPANNGGGTMQEQRIVTTGGALRTVSGAALDKLSSRLSGTLLTGGEAGYDDARTVWNGLVNRRPAVIAPCAGTSDVAESVRFASDHGLLVSVRGGGHSAAGRAVCEGGLMIDLSPMRQVHVDAAARTASAQGGVRLGEFDSATEPFGLATTLGVATDTGIAGLTLGGGYGWLNGKFGLACDNLLSVEIVTADGAVLTASAEENPDLFWGIRGAGANFGVVTSFRYQLHPVGQVLAGLMLYPISAGREALQLFHTFSASCPDEVSTVGLLLVPLTARRRSGSLCVTVGPSRTLSRHCGLSERSSRRWRI